VGTSHALRRRSLARVLAAASVLLAVAAVLGPAGAAAASGQSVTVAVVDDETHAPLVGARVTLTAALSPGAAALFVRTGHTDADGAAVFANVPRTSAGRTVLVSATAALRETHDVDGCSVVESWTGSSDPARPTSTISVAASRTAAATCPDPGPGAPALTGIVLDPAGHPLASPYLTVALVSANGTTWSKGLRGRTTGTFRVAVPAWGTADAPAHVTVAALGTISGYDTHGDCTVELAPKGATERDLALVESTAGPLTVHTELSRVGEVCAATGTPNPSSAPQASPNPDGSSRTAPRPAASRGDALAGTAGRDRGRSRTGVANVASSPSALPTLPSTDVAAASRDAGDAPAHGLALALVAVAIAVAGVVGRQGRRRRR
jgi:hypothetical protein